MKALSADSMDKKRSRCLLQKSQLGILSQPIDGGHRGDRPWAAFGLDFIAQIITPFVGRTEVWPAHGSHPNPARTRPWCSSGGSGSCEPAQLSRSPHGRCHQNQLGWTFPLLGLPIPTHSPPKPHRALTSIHDHFWRSFVLFSWKFLHHKFGNGQTPK